ncbi:four-carbon acid sugar kinase family protein [Thalassobacillus sp. CUG 92003]|uniref:four-carbon acid sugar kinase family protein n=1 Tax=Thalassobacillus sp. CUG 92003 TaxID=2736641 RepID=UPI0015E651B8|nr:four-carbon acid sugar kinase family protein [Thalassobacillus sp. CUG 92003]
MNVRFGMIADDLTGANDSGVQLKEKGIETSVFFEIPTLNESLDEAIVIDTDSRALNQDQAYHATEAAAQFLSDSGCRHIYKKMDSTLRGYIGAELKAMGHVFDPVFTVVAPAFPPYGRTTKNGWHLLDGRPISETELAHDAKHPVKQAHLPTLIEEETGEKTALISEALLHGDADDWLMALNDWKAKNITYLICDAASGDDLSKIATMINRFTSRVVWAGSAGLAEVLPQVLELENETTSPAPIEGGAILTICGSLSQKTQEQIIYTTEQPGIHAIPIDTGNIFTKEWQRDAEDYYQSSMEAYEEGKDVVLYVPATDEMRQEVKQKAEAMGLGSFEIGKRISEALGELTHKLVKANTDINSLVLTGGDTAKDVAKSLGATGFSLSHQLEPGIPVGTLIGTERVINVVTKAGAFGTETSLYQAIVTLKGAHQHEPQTDHWHYHG